MIHDLTATRNYIFNTLNEFADLNQIFDFIASKFYEGFDSIAPEDKFNCKVTKDEIVLFDGSVVNLELGFYNKEDKKPFGKLMFKTIREDKQVDILELYFDNDFIYYSPTENGVIAVNNSYLSKWLFFTLLKSYLKSSKFQ